MICFQCVLKHLAGALSYGKQVISGHGKGADLDHRIDYLGQITNAEQHLELIDKNLFNQISTYRKQLQSKKIQVDQTDLQFVRKLYIMVQLKEDGQQLQNNTYYIAQDNVDVVYEQITNLEYFKLSYHLLKQNLTDYNKIYVLKSSVDLSQFDVQVVNMDIKQFALTDKLSQDFIYMYQNTSFLKKTSGKQIIPTYSLKNRDIALVEQFRRLGIQKTIYNYEKFKVQPIKKTQFNEILKNYDGKHPISYYSVRDGANLAMDNQFNVVVDRPVCCSTKSNLKVKHYVNWDHNGFQSLKKFLNFD